MRVVYVAPYYPSGLPAQEVLNRFPLLTRLPEAMRARGHQVRVLGQADTDLREFRAGVGYEFRRTGPIARMVSRVMDGWKPRYGRAYYEAAWPMALRVLKLRPDIVHVFGLTMDLHLALLTSAARQVGARVIVHYHGGLPAESKLLKAIQRRNLRKMDVLLVTAAEQTSAWYAAGLIPARLNMEILVESSSPLNGINREVARRVTGITGDPVCLSVGRLHPIKDPLTMLRGFERIVRERPAARLYLYYLTSEMLEDLRTYVRDSDPLRTSVEFRGRAEPDEMEAICSSADYLLQASTREWSGLAILEAMSCGCIPAVTDIPSFRQMTGKGRFGLLFPVGDDRALANRILGQASSDRARLAIDVQEHFQQELSFPAMAEKLEKIYESALARS